MCFMLDGVFGGCESYLGADDKEYFRCLILQGVQSYTFGISKEMFDKFGKFKLYSSVFCTVQMSTYQGNIRLRLISAKISQ